MIKFNSSLTGVTRTSHDHQHGALGDDPSACHHQEPSKPSKVQIAQHHGGIVSLFLSSCLSLVLLSKQFYKLMLLIIFFRCSQRRCFTSTLMPHWISFSLVIFITSNPLGLHIWLGPANEFLKLQQLHSESNVILQVVLSVKPVLAAIVLVTLNVEANGCA